MESSVQEELIALGYLHEELSTYPPILPWVSTACPAEPALISSVIRETEREKAN